MQRFSFVAVTSFLGRVLFLNGFSLSLVFVIGGRVVCQLNTKLSTHFFFVIFVSFGYCYYGWAFGLPKNFKVLQRPCGLASRQRHPTSRPCWGSSTPRAPGPVLQASVEVAVREQLLDVTEIWQTGRNTSSSSGATR